MGSFFLLFSCVLRAEAPTGSPEATARPHVPEVRNSTTIDVTYPVSLLRFAVNAPPPPPPPPPSASPQRSGPWGSRGLATTGRQEIQRRNHRSPVGQSCVDPLRLGLRGRPGSVPGGGVFCPCGAACVTNSTSSLLPLSSVLAGRHTTPPPHCAK